MWKQGALCVLIGVAGANAQAQESAQAANYESVEALGEALFFDVNLSLNRTQSCASCHDPDHGYVDVRETDAGRAVSLGDDGHSLGDRNAPTAAYAMFSPPFQLNDMGYYMGGQFLDGSAVDLAAQAGGPPLNPIEMGMPDKASVVARLQENQAYITALETHFGKDVFTETEAAYVAMTQSIAAYEKTDIFAPFDSKYDRFLLGEYQMSAQEALGRSIFFDKTRSNCNLCHMLHWEPDSPRETFTAYEYHNIGVPTNVAVRKISGVPLERVDNGLLGNAAVRDFMENGKFRTPTLRNIAITGPYMHNGVFNDLRTTVEFYNKYNSTDPVDGINPETGAPWRGPEVPQTLAMRELTHGAALSEAEIDALVAFMETLTDARYEPLLKD